MQLTGKLEFTIFGKPIKLFTNTGEEDLWIHYKNFFIANNGKKIKMEYNKNFISLYEDESSEYNLKFEEDSDGLLCILDKNDGCGFSNISAYLPDMLQRLNGRKVIVTIEDDKINICADPDDKVFGLYYTKNNSCKIPEDKINEICKIGTTDCCIFCSAGADGFQCEKFNSMFARDLLYRYVNKTMRASRIGNCENLGRKEE